MTYTEVVEKHIKQAGWWSLISICLMVVAFVTILFAAACHFYGELYYWIPSSNNAFPILLSGLLAAIFSHQLGEKSERLTDKAEYISLFAKQQTAKIQLEEVLVKALTHFYKKDKGTNFDGIQNFKDLEFSLKQFCMTTTGVVEETGHEVMRLLYSVANADWLNQALEIDSYVEIEKLKYEPISELVQEIRGDFDTFLQIVASNQEADSETVEMIFALLALRQKLRHLIDSVEQGKSASVIAFDHLKRKHAAE